MKEKLETAQAAMELTKTALVNVMNAAADEGNKALYQLSVDMWEVVGKFNERLKRLSGATRERS